MMVSKAKTESFLKPALYVDSWKLSHNENQTMEEKFIGKLPMEEKSSLMYLGYVLSQNRSNMPNINHKKNKAKGTQKLIPKLIEPLGMYRFESAIIYIESLLRSSILYGAEAMNNVKELEWRELEKIEEAVLSKVFETTRSCSRHLLYLEAGMIPARFLVMRQMLARLQYILQQPTDSLLHRVYQAQLESPTSGDWASETSKILQMLKIELCNEDIKDMKASQFKSLIRKRTEIVAFSYLCQKQIKGQKGREIPYSKVQMADYLLPDSCATFEEKFDIFETRVEVNDMPYNYGKKMFCIDGCEDLLTNKHILICPHLNKSNSLAQFYQLLNGNVEEKNEVTKVFKLNLLELTHKFKKA